MTDAAAITGRKNTVRKNVESLPRMMLFSTIASTSASPTRRGTPMSTNTIERPKEPQNRGSFTSSR